MSTFDNDALAIINALTEGLAHNLTEAELPAAQHEACAAEFVEMIGRLVELFQHPSSAKGAAILYLVDKFGLDKAGEQSAKIMVTLVESMKVIAQSMKEAREKAATPKIH